MPPKALHQVYETPSMIFLKARVLSYLRLSYLIEYLACTNRCLNSEVQFFGTFVCRFRDADIFNTKFLSNELEMLPSANQTGLARWTIPPKMEDFSRRNFIKFSMVDCPRHTFDCQRDRHPTW